MPALKNKGNWKLVVMYVFVCWDDLFRNLLVIGISISIGAYLATFHSFSFLVSNNTGYDFGPRPVGLHRLLTLLQHSP